MPRFYLHLSDIGGFFEDEEGAEYPDLDTAKAEAAKGLRDSAAGEIRRGLLNIASFIEIEDESRALVATVHFTEAVSVKGIAKPESD